MLSSKNNTILLVNSDASLSHSLTDSLNGVGFSVLSAGTEEEALMLVEIARPDLILLDCSVGGENYQQILSSLKSNALSSHIPVIIISQDIDVNSKVQGLLMGANDYIVRPFRFAEVLARINTQLRIVSMQKELEEKNRILVQNNILLQQLSTRDNLTGLYNREYIMGRALDELNRAARYNEPISVIIADLDYFKNINDTYGHLAGDLVMKETASILKTSVRESDVAARYGGEEFLIVCPRTDEAGAQQLGERIRGNIERASVVFEGRKISITISLGIRSCLPKVGDELTAIIGEADIALYKAKSSGRNQIKIYHQAEIKEKSTGKSISDCKEAHEGYTH